MRERDTREGNKKNVEQEEYIWITRFKCATDVKLRVYLYACISCVYRYTCLFIP